MNGPRGGLVIGPGKPRVILRYGFVGRSGGIYQEYALVKGEDAEAVLRFLFRAMAPKEDNPFEGIPEGSVAKTAAEPIWRI